MPNADVGNSKISEQIRSFAAGAENRYLFDSLGQTKYLSMLSLVDGVIGNSSSGLAEAPSFKIGTINIGDRQKGRVQASSVLNCDASELNIAKAIEEMYSDDFQTRLKSTVNPYGTGGASLRIVEILKEVNFEGLLIKSFNDL